MTARHAASARSSVVIIGCGAKKATGTTAAGQMYVGGYHRSCRRAADQLISSDRILILPAKYALLHLTDLISPYEQRLDQPGAVAATDLQRQARALGLEHDQDVIILAGRAYTRLARTIWPAAATQLAGVGGMGRQLQWLKHAAEHPDTVGRNS